MRFLRLALSFLALASLLPSTAFADDCGYGPGLGQWRCTAGSSNQSATVSPSSNGVTIGIGINGQDQGTLKRIVKYVAPGVGAGAKLMHDHFLTGDRQGAPGTVDQQTRTSAATA